MNRTARLARVITLAFSLALGLWVAADRYVGLSGVGTSALRVAADATAAVMVMSAAALLAVWAYRFFRNRSMPVDAVIFVGAMVGAELLWRFVVHDLPDNGFKLVAVALFFAQPLIAILGVAAAVMALLRSRRSPVSNVR